MSEPLSILIVDDDCRMAKTLGDIFRVKGYHAEMAGSAVEALEKIEQQSFDCILSDIKMPETNGVELYRAIKDRRPDIPVVLMTAYSADTLVQEGLAEGVVAVLNKPLDINLVLNFLALLRKERSIVIVDDDPNFCRTLGDILQARGFVVTTMTDPQRVTEQLEAEGHVLLLDMRLGSTDGLTVLKEVRRKHPHLPVMLVTGYRQEMAAAIEAALQINAYTCFYKPLQIEQLLQTLAQIQRQELGRKLGQLPKKDNKKAECDNTS